MKFGISLSAMAQQPVGTDMTRAFRDIVEYVRAARELGFHFVYQGQQYLTEPYQQIQTMPLLARLAADAEGMELVATLLVQRHHPVDLAERVTAMDIISGGRFILSAALGFRPEEFSGLGVDLRHRVSRYLECLEVMKRLWTEEEVTFHGKHFRLEDARLLTKPTRKPHPDIWVAATSDAAVRRAVRLGYPWYPGASSSFSDIKLQREHVKEAAVEAGKSMPPDFPVMRDTYIHPDREVAFREARPFLEDQYATYAQWGQDKQHSSEETFAVPFEELAKGRFIIGTPEDCIEELERYRTLGMTHATLRMIWQGMELQKGIQILKLFSQRVMPHFRAT